MKNWFETSRVQSELHPKFKFLLHPEYITERELLKQWINDFNSPDGDIKSKDEFQKTFHSVFLELYINQVLIQSSGRIDTSRQAPDFRVECDRTLYSVEATVANIADDDRKEDTRTESDIYGVNSYYEIVDASISRLARRLKIKSSDFIKKYDRETQSLPFVIAVGDYSSVNYGQAAYFSPLAALYCAYHDPEERMSLKILCSDSEGREYKHKFSHIIKSDKEIEVGFFCSHKHAHISAVIYTCTLSLGKISSLTSNHKPSRKYVCVERESGQRLLRFSGGRPDEVLGDGLFVFHNPFASQPLSNEFLTAKGVTHIRYDDENSLITTSRPFSEILTRRYVGPESLVSTQLPRFEEFKFFPVLG